KAYLAGDLCPEMKRVASIFPGLVRQLGPSFLAFKVGHSEALPGALRCLIVTPNTARGRLDALAALMCSGACAAEEWRIAESVTFKPSSARSRGSGLPRRTFHTLRGYNQRIPAGAPPSTTMV